MEYHFPFVAIPSAPAHWLLSSVVEEGSRRRTVQSDARCHESVHSFLSLDPSDCKGTLRYSRHRGEIAPNHAEIDPGASEQVCWCHENDKPSNLTPIRRYSVRRLESQESWRSSGVFLTLRRTPEDLKKY